MAELNWDEIRNAFWVMVGMVSVNAKDETDLSGMIVPIDKLLKEKLKEEWKN